MEKAFVLRELQALRQAQASQGRHPEGLILSERTHPLLLRRRIDDNIFYTASIVYILNAHRETLTEEERQEVDTFSSTALSTFSHYRNKDGELTYNFWRTNPSQHFPDSNYFHRLRHFKLPDDLDTTCMVYLASGLSTNEILELRQKATRHANLHKARTAHSFWGFESKPIFSTWFGERMPIEYDLCVLCNYFLLRATHDIPLSEEETASLAFIFDMFSTNRFIHYAYHLSPSYHHPVILAYHLARVLATKKIDLLNPLEEILTRFLSPFCTQQTMLGSIARNALSRLGVPVNSSSPPSLPTDMHTFQWFSGSLLSPYSHLPIIQSLAPFKLFHMGHPCPLFNRCLFVEELLIQRKF